MVIATSTTTNWVAVLTLIGTALTLIALFFAIWHLRRNFKDGKAIRDTSSKLETVLNDLQEVSDSLSTRYIGEISDTLLEVSRMIDSTPPNTRLLILVASPVPVFFSDPPLFARYSQSIVQAFLRGVSIRMICMNEEHRFRRLKLQFPTNSDQYTAWIQRNEPLLHLFLNQWYPEITDSSVDGTTLVTLVRDAQTKCFQRSIRDLNIPVLEVDEMITTQAWIKDTKEAIFSFQADPTRAASHGIKTTDGRLILALQDMHSNAECETQKI